MNQDLEEVLETGSEKSGPNETGSKNPNAETSGSDSEGGQMSTFLKTIKVVADLVIVGAVVGFVDSVIGYTSSEDASLAAGLIVFSFVVKGWIDQYAGNRDEETGDTESENEISSGNTVMLTVGIVLLASITFGAMDEADNAMDEADDAMSKVEDFEYRVEGLEY